MKKFSKFTLAALVASSIISTASANWYDNIFVSAQVGYNFKSDISANYNVPFTGASGKFDASEGQIDLGFKAGYDFGDFRAYGAVFPSLETKGDSAISAYSSFDEEPKWSGNDFVLGADFTPKFSLGGIDFKGIIGLYGGLSYLDLSYNAVNNAPGGDTFKFDSSFDGFVYGLRLGGIYDLNDKSEVEFGFKFDQANYKDKDFSFVVCNYGTCTTIDPMQVTSAKRTKMGVFVGYNYKF